MKKLLLLIIALLFINFTKAQESKAYFGFSLGYAIPGGDGSEYLGSGLNVGFVNFGYRFTKSWGATFNCTSSGFTINSFNDGTIGLATFSIGPMYTVGLSKKLSLDLKPQYAFISKAKLDIPSGIATFDGTGYGFGSSLNFGISKGFKFSLNLDYYNSKFDDTEADFLGQTSAISYKNANQFILSTGLRYNFK